MLKITNIKWDVTDGTEKTTPKEDLYPYGTSDYR